VENALTKGGDFMVLGKLIGATLLQHNLKELNDLAINGLVEKWEQFESNYNKNFGNYFEKSITNLNKVRTILNDRTQSLTDIFQPTSLHEKIREGRRFSEKVIEPNDFLPLISEKKCVWITGHGGIGKSTLLKHTMLTILMDEKKSKNKIPVYIELRKYNYEEVKRRSIIDFVYNEMNVTGFELNKKIFEYMLRKGRFLFLFDAYDEITSEKSQIFLQEFEDFLTKYDRNNMVISSRFMPKGHLDNFIKLHELKTNGLTKQESIQLIGKTKYAEEIKKEFIKSLSDGLYDEYESIASNPTLLLLMLSLFRENSNFPKEKSSFLIKAFEELFERHDGRKIAYTRDFRCKELSKYQMMKVFSAFCFLTYFDSNASQDEFSEEYINEKLDRIIKGFSWLKSAKITAENLLYDFRVCLCILYKEGEKFYFVHNIFQEFFSAYHIYKSDEKTQKKFLSKYALTNISNKSQEEPTYNYRIIQTTFDYICELDISEDQSVIKYRLLLPLLEMVESNPHFIDYHHLEHSVRYGITFEEDKIEIRIIPVPLRYQNNRALFQLYNLYDRGTRVIYSRKRFVPALPRISITKEEYETISALPLLVNKFLQERKDTKELERQVIEVPIENVLASDILNNLYIKSPQYKRNEKLKGLCGILKEDRLMRDNEEESLL
jgi:energy-coupling factor transporter ATP-binding protein EcfA2